MSTMSTSTSLAGALMTQADILEITRWDRRTFKKIRKAGRWPDPLFCQGGKGWWSRRQVERALGLLDDEPEEK